MADLSGQSKKIRVLFLGNSYTYVNDLPGMTASLAISKGDTMIWDSNCPGGYTFNNHFNDATSKAKISAGNWDYVVLQAQSQEPAFPPSQVSSQTLPYALKLDSLIKKSNPCAVTVFYETWGRKNGDQSNCAFYPPLCTYLGMQDRLKISYKLFADSCKAIIAPVGEAFRASISFSPTLELYQTDESHPSVEGTYLAASVFYKTLFHKNPVGSLFMPVAGGSTVGVFLQNRAQLAVNDSLEVWNLGKNAPWAPFQVIFSNNPTFQFYSFSAAMNNTWYFGNGASTTATHPSYTYSAAGVYSVSHVVTKGCLKDSSVITLVSASSVGIKNTAREDLISVYPNPFTDQVSVSAGEEILSLSLFTPDGRELLSKEKVTELNLSTFDKGIYFLKVQTASRTSNCRLIKQ
jgi:hypothetical protein